MLSLKPGVRINGLKPEILLAIQIVHSVFVANKKNCVITSCVEGQHSRGSKHYSGNAIDVRTRHLLPTEREAIEADCRESLGAEYDVVFETTHLHIEYDPKTPIGA